MKKFIKFFFVIFLFFVSCQTNQPQDKNSENSGKKLEKTTLGGGCFWCLSPCFEMLKGVYKVTSGYSGGNNEYPTYQEVSSGTTGHAEVVQIEYDPEEISFLEILDVFWFLHDPTQLNKQFEDVGTQYRSVIFFRSEEQKILAQESLKKSEKTDLWSGKYVTQISPFANFYPAEDYHQQYFKQNQFLPYCKSVISPKIQKFKSKFYYKLKPEFQDK
ncbi:peptide-methionine (S)-S-oxide reductase MsrA [Apibacter raozihei]|uniref:peptide-methionine (S)-S-oxide reductase MsrA n=1 Tax=Apibacter raozihei TaxID=2500547 RepID=UPI000FE37014|nr:peptide-methionine (S)-S-oxide reductase MsrA [Apibacter raozihei]